MPPGSINQNNTPSISNVLTQEETTELIAQFEQHRKVLKCPHCEKQGLFRRNGYTKTEPRKLFSVVPAAVVVIEL